MVTAANTTILCCPMDSTCMTISPISCNLTLQIPGNNIQTTCHDGELEKCGDGGCCPWGYRCNSGNHMYCVTRADDINSPPAGCESSSSQISETSSTTISSSSLSSSTHKSESKSSKSDGGGGMQIPTGTSIEPSSTTYTSTSAALGLTTGIELVPTTSQAATAASGAPLSTAELVGIALGSFFGVAFLVLALYIVCQKYKSRGGNEQSQETAALASQGQASSEPKIPSRAELQNTEVYELAG